MPLTLIRRTCTAVDTSSVSITSMSVGCSLASYRNTICPPIPPVINSVACAMAFSISVYVVKSFILPSIRSSVFAMRTSAKLVFASPSSISLYRSASTSHTTRITFAVASTPNSAYWTVTVSHKLTRSSGAIFLYSSVCHKAIKSIFILTFGIHGSLLLRMVCARASSCATVGASENSPDKSIGTTCRRDARKVIVSPFSS